MVADAFSSYFSMLENARVFLVLTVFLYPLSLSGTPYDPYKALWFERKKDPVTKELTHIYRGGYWECKEKQDWSSCPDIF